MAHSFCFQRGISLFFSSHLTQVKQWPFLTEASDREEEGERGKQRGWKGKIEQQVRRDEGLVMAEGERGPLSLAKYYYKKNEFIIHEEQLPRWMVWDGHFVLNIELYFTTACQTDSVAQQGTLTKQSYLSNWLPTFLSSPTNHNITWGDPWPPPPSPPPTNSTRASPNTPRCQPLTQQRHFILKHVCEWPFKYTKPPLAQRLAFAPQPHTHTHTET